MRQADRKGCREREREREAGAGLGEKLAVVLPSCMRMNGSALFGTCNSLLSQGAELIGPDKKSANPSEGVVAAPHYDLRHAQA